MVVWTLLVGGGLEVNFNIHKEGGDRCNQIDHDEGRDYMGEKQRITDQEAFFQRKAECVIRL